LTPERTTLLLRIGAAVGLPASLFLTFSNFQDRHHVTALFNAFVAVMFLAMLVGRVTVTPRK
jgi:hypothetical protein